jgi:hypothetical protein
VKRDPFTFPTAPAIETKVKSSFPSVTKAPANGMISSDGNGISADSIAIATITPQ